jgi:hypothetical protein
VTPRKSSRSRSKRSRRSSSPRTPPTHPARSNGRALTSEDRLRSPSGTVRVDEPVHTHIVCQACGRIAQFPLAPEEETILLLLAERHPKDWEVDRIAFSLTGSCRACRQGRPQ